MSTAARSSPFFIIGCVRSGTTMLRDALRMHPDLAAPEETHFYRWPDPFGTENARKQLLNNRTLRRHREIDGIDNEEFVAMLEKASTRRELYRLYMKSYLRKTKPQARRWFDKTPQNVYGAAMLAADFPHSRLVHIVRNPIDVVLSLREGKVMEVRNLVGACNYWRESVAIITTLKRSCRARLLELRYEEVTADPGTHMSRLLEFLGESGDLGFMSSFVARPSTHDATQLSRAELRIVERICGRWAAAYDYPIGASADGDAA